MTLLGHLLVDVVSVLFRRVVEKAVERNISVSQLVVITSKSQCDSNSTRLKQVIEKSVDANLDISPMNLRFVVKVQG